VLGDIYHFFLDPSNHIVSSLLQQNLPPLSLRASAVLYILDDHNPSVILHPENHASVWLTQAVLYYAFGAVDDVLGSGVRCLVSRTPDYQTG
jgi:hypothetical protein